MTWQPAFANMPCCALWSAVGSVHLVLEALSGAAPVLAMVCSNVELPGLNTGQSAARTVDMEHTINAAIENTRIDGSLRASVALMVVASDSGCRWRADT